MTVKGKNMKNKIAILSFVSLLAAAAPTVQAGHVSFSIGANIGIPTPVVSVRAYAPSPVYYAAPPPVFVATPRVVYQAPVACAAPVYVAPAPVVYQRPVCVAPPVVYAPAPCYTTPAFGFRIGFGHGYSHHGRW
jgi:hypothetical protein